MYSRLKERERLTSTSSSSARTRGTCLYSAGAVGVGITDPVPRHIPELNGPAKEVILPEAAGSCWDIGAAPEGQAATVAVGVRADVDSVTGRREEEADDHSEICEQHDEDSEGDVAVVLC